MGFAFAAAVSECAGEARESYGGDCSGVCAEGAESGAVFEAFGVEFLFCFAVDAYERMVGFAAAGVYGHDRIRQLHQDAQPDMRGCFVGFQYEVREAGGAGCVPAPEFRAVAVAVVVVRLPVACDGCAQEPAAVRAALRECGGRVVRGAAECGRAFL